MGVRVAVHLSEPPCVRSFLDYSIEWFDLL